MAKCAIYRARLFCDKGTGVMFSARQKVRYIGSHVGGVGPLCVACKGVCLEPSHCCVQLMSQMCDRRLVAGCCNSNSGHNQ